RMQRRWLGQALTERPIVAGGGQRREHGRVDEPITFLECPEGRLQHGEHFGTDRDVAAVTGIQPGQLAVREEPREARLRLADRLLATLQRRLPAANTQELAGRAERVEMAGREFTRHGFHSGRWRRSAAPSPPDGAEPVPVWATWQRRHQRARPATACPAPTPTSASRLRTCSSPCQVQRDGPWISGDLQPYGRGIGSATG